MLCAAATTSVKQHPRLRWLSLELARIAKSINLSRLEAFLCQSQRFSTMMFSNDVKLPTAVAIRCVAGAWKLL